MKIKHIIILILVFFNFLVLDCQIYDHPNIVDITNPITVIRHTVDSFSITPKGLPTNRFKVNSNLPDYVKTIEVGKEIILQAERNDNKDDTYAIQAAIDYFHYNGVVYIPPGKFNVNNLIINKTFIDITGGGTLINGSIQIGNKDPKKSEMEYKYITISNISFRNSSLLPKNNSGYSPLKENNLITIQNSWHVKIQNCNFIGGHTAILINDRHDSVPKNTWSHAQRIIISENFFKDCKFNILSLHNNKVKYSGGDFQIINNIFSGTPQRHISLNGQDGAIISDNTFFNANDISIYINNSTKIHITNNRIFCDEISDYGIFIRSSWGCIIQSNEIIKPKISGITIRNLDEGKESGFNLINENMIQRPGDSGIDIRGIHNSIISSNIIFKEKSSCDQNNIAIVLYNTEYGNCYENQILDNNTPKMITLFQDGVNHSINIFRQDANIGCGLKFGIDEK